MSTFSHSFELSQHVADVERKNFFNQLVQDVWEEVQQGAAHGVSKAVILAKKKL